MPRARLPITRVKVTVNHAVYDADVIEEKYDHRGWVITLGNLVQRQDEREPTPEPKKETILVRKRKQDPDIITEVTKGLINEIHNPANGGNAYAVWDRLFATPTSPYRWEPHIDPVTLVPLMDQVLQSNNNLQPMSADREARSILVNGTSLVQVIYEYQRQGKHILQRR